MQTVSNKNNTIGSQKDLWLVIREGSLEDVDLALARLKKSGGNVNSRNVFGLTPLHVATWRNHIPIVRRLLSAGADPDTRDGESGWSSLHRALHFGHLAVAGIFIQSGASTTLEDTKFRMPIDLLSGPVLQAIGDGHSSASEVFSWGSGANYQLGSGNEHIQKLPCKVDALQDSYIKLVSAARFHSVAVSSRGEVYTWGFGRGGRLGHPDFDIHSGQAAVITPRQVTRGIGSRRVKAIAAAKHHTVLATEGGEVFTWGSNREGQLGYIVDTQSTPRRVSSLKSRIVAVAAANKHTAVVSDVGEVFTWGCNREGQLGYGTSNSASNYNPRVVDYLKGRSFTGVSAAKHHTVVLGADGEVYTWGHKVVTPRRVVIARNLKKSGSNPLKFHRWERLHAAAIAAGMVHSLALTDDGALFYWVSADPDLKSQQLYSMCGKPIVSISSGKYWSSIVTAAGDVYTWDGKIGKNEPPYVTRLHGVKKASSVSVGETHLLIVSALYHPAYSPDVLHRTKQEKLKVRDEAEELDDCSLLDETESGSVLPTVDKENFGQKPVPSLKSLCEKVAAENLVELRNVMQMLEIAHSFGADDLRKYCEDIAIHNLDYILAVASHSFSSASPEILAHLEHVLDERSSEPWSYRKLPTQTAILPVIIDSEEEESEPEFLRTRDKHNNTSITKNEGDQRSDFFLRLKEHPDQDISKKVRALWKKLQQIEMLEAKQSDGHDLDHQQLAKLQMRSTIENSLADLGFPVETTPEKVGSVVFPLVKNSKKTKLSKKQRRNKGKMDQADTVPSVSGTDIEEDLARDFSKEVSVSQVSTEKKDDIVSEAGVGNSVSEGVIPVQKKDILAPPKCKTSSPLSSKKKTRKGGLSMFLSGALDDVPKVTPPPMPRTEGPAWGGAKVSKGSASLREIQDEQRRLIMEQPVKNKDPREDQNNQKNGVKVLLPSFLPSKPIPVVSASTSRPSDGATASWASGTPPHLSCASLRDIQMQQEQKQQRLAQIPKAQMTGFTVSPGQDSPSDSLSMNRWFKPDVEVPSSIRSIQIEEKAMKDLKRFYRNVKIGNQHKICPMLFRSLFPQVFALI